MCMAAKHIEPCRLSALDLCPSLNANVDEGRRTKDQGPRSKDHKIQEVRWSPCRKCGLSGRLVSTCPATSWRSSAAGRPIVCAAKRPQEKSSRRWMWDGEFCGSIGLRWQRGTDALPPYCLGHIGYAVVPWKRRRGYATQALREALRDAAAEGLRY